MGIIDVNTARFGTVEAPEERVITMEKPILGFERLKRFIIVQREDFQPFHWLQSLEEPEVAFVIVTPTLFFPDFAVEVNRKEVEDIGVTDVSAVEMYAIVTVPDDPRKMTANLQGPLVINTITRQAKQLVMANTERSVAHPLFEPLAEDEAPTPAMAEL